MGKPGIFGWLFLALFGAFGSKNGAIAQSGGSIFKSGAWGKVGVTARGVYKIDVAALSSMGLMPAGGTVVSDKIRLFGSGGAMLPEAVGAQRFGSFTENAILINDGGDGVFIYGFVDYVFFCGENTVFEPML